jgi:hypothetical protein
MKCRNKKIQSNIEEIPSNIVNTEDEKWIKYDDRYISSKGRVTNLKGNYLEIDKTKGRIYINGKAEYMSRVMTRAFKIENYELIDKDQTYVVS